VQYVDANADVNVPGLHGEQLSDAPAVANKPTAHALHAIALTPLLLPGGQKLHATA
jgi:hypothetical protein